MEENVSREYRKEEKDKLLMELIIEPNAIDTFWRELKMLAEKEDGITELKESEITQVILYKIMHYNTIYSKMDD